METSRPDCEGVIGSVLEQLISRRAQIQLAIDALLPLVPQDEKPNPERVYKHSPEKRAQMAEAQRRWYWEHKKREMGRATK